MKLRILIVDDSRLERKLMQSMINSDPEMEVVGEAESGYLGVKKARELKPDAMVLDLIMPNGDGFWTAETVLREDPIPIVLFSGLTTPDAEITAELFHRGILDVVKKPRNSSALKVCREEFVTKVKAAAKSKSTFQSFFKLHRPTTRPISHADRPATSVIAIIASAGSPFVLSQLLRNICEQDERFRKMDTAVLVALHMPKEFLGSFVKSLHGSVSCPISIAKEGAIIHSNKIYFSPAESTLCFNRIKIGALLKHQHLDMKMQPHFDTFLKSAAGAFGKNVVAIILSGMGSHGLEGARTVVRLGGNVIAQDPATAGVSAMPLSVINEGLAEEIKPVSKIVDSILMILEQKQGPIKRMIHSVSSSIKNSMSSQTKP